MGLYSKFFSQKDWSLRPIQFMVFFDWEELDRYFLDWGSLTLPIFRYEGLSQEQFQLVIGMLDKFSESFDHLIFTLSLKFFVINNTPFPEGWNSY